MYKRQIYGLDSTNVKSLLRLCPCSERPSSGLSFAIDREMMLMKFLAELCLKGYQYMIFMKKWPRIASTCILEA